MKKKFSFSQIINMNLGFFGIQYSFGLQQSAVNPIYDMLGASPDEIPFLNLAGPLTGLIIQPIIGAMSDKTYSHQWGRRKPYFLIGAIVCSICLFIYPYSSSLWMAAGLLWILDAGNNTAMEPYRAFVGDLLDHEQQPQGFLAQSFFTGLGQTLANLSLFIFPIFILGKTGKLPNWVFASFFLGALCSIVSILWSIYTTPEQKLSDEEIRQLRSEKLNIFSPFIDVFKAIFSMPRKMWLLSIVYLFQWYALFCYWQNSSKCVAENAYHWQAPSEDDRKIQEKISNLDKQLKKYYATTSTDYTALKQKDSTSYLLYMNHKQYGNIDLSPSEILKLDGIDQNVKIYEQAVSRTGLINAWYNVVTFLVAFLLARFAVKYGARRVHAISLLLTGISFILFAYFTSVPLLFATITGLGIGWASIMGVPFLLVNKEITSERRGVYMGIINMMIVIPMFIQTFTFGAIMRNFLNNKASNAILFAGILVLIAGSLTYYLFRNDDKKDRSIPL